MDGFYKEARITTVDEPYLKPISDEGIGFYNMDINTAVLTFQVRSCLLYTSPSPRDRG